ncbi:MAG TPA: response regulator, partial [Iamia sp.]
MRVVIGEDLALLRDGLIRLLEANGCTIVAAVEDEAGLRRSLLEDDLDVAVVDVRLPPTFTDDGVRAAIEARARHPGLGVLILSQYVEPVYT